MPQTPRVLSYVLVLVGVQADLPAAQISFIAQFNNAAYSQTSAAQPAAGSAVFFFDGQLIMQNAGDFSAANVLLPGGVQPSNGTNGGANPDTALLSPTVFQYASPSLSQAAYNAEFPTGIYTYTGINSPNQTVTVNEPAPVYSTAIPFVTDFASLLGLNAASPFTVTWNAFAGALGGTCNGTGTTCSNVFFDITKNSTGSSVFSFDFQPSTTTSVTIPANTLQANTAYTFQLIFDNRQITSYSSGSAAFLPDFGSDVRTTGTFTTAAAAVPEPSTTVSLIGLAAIVLLGRRSARSAA